MSAVLTAMERLLRGLVRDLPAVEKNGRVLRPYAAFTTLAAIFGTGTWWHAPSHDDPRAGAFWWLAVVLAILAVVQMIGAFVVPVYLRFVRDRVLPRLPRS